MRTKIAILGSVASLVIVGCGKTDEEKAWEQYETARSKEILEELANKDSDEGFDSPTLPATEEGASVPVSSDPRASYRLMRKRRMSNGHWEALTRRDGPSGTSFSRREIDCDAMQFRYLGEGDTQAEAEEDGPNPGRMADILPPSISAEVTRFVCSKA